MVVVEAVVVVEETSVVKGAVLAESEIAGHSLSNRFRDHRSHIRTQALHRRTLRRPQKLGCVGSHRCNPLAVATVVVTAVAAREEATVVAATVVAATAAAAMAVEERAVVTVVATVVAVRVVADTEEVTVGAMAVAAMGVERAGAAKAVAMVERRRFRRHNSEPYAAQSK